MANLKVVVKHHSTSLLEAFKKNIVGYSNCVWGVDIISDAVKNRILSSNIDVAQQASDLLSNVSTAFASASDVPIQTDYMKELFRFLESEGENKIVKSMREELHISFHIDIPSFYGTPSDQGSRHYPHFDPMFDDENYLSQSEIAYNIDSDVPEPHKLVGIPPPTGAAQYGRQSQSMVLPGDQSNGRHFEQSDPIISNRKFNQRNRGQRRVTEPAVVGLYRAPLRTHTRPHASNSSPSVSFDGDGHHDQLSESSSHYEEQKYLCNIVLIKKYDEENRELKKTLEDKNKEILALKNEHMTRVHELNEQIKNLRCDVRDKGDMLQKVSDMELKLLNQDEKSESLHTKIAEELNSFKKEYQAMLDRQQTNDGRELKKRMEEKKKEINALKREHQTHVDQLNRQIEKLQCVVTDKEELVRKIANIEKKLAKQEDNAENLHSKMAKELDAFKVEYLCDRLKEANSRSKLDYLIVSVVFLVFIVLFILVCMWK